MDSHFVPGDIVQLKMPSSKGKESQELKSKLFISVLKYIDTTISSDPSFTGERFVLITQAHELWNRFGCFPLSPKAEKREWSSEEPRIIEADEAGLPGHYVVAPFEVEIQGEWIEKKVGTLSSKCVKEFTETDSPTTVMIVDKIPNDLE